MGKRLEFRVIARETRTFSRNPDPNDSWDVGDTDVDVDFESALICPEDFPGNLDTHFVESSGCGGSFPWKSKSIKSVHLVVARFTTGSTFGRTSGEWKVHAAFVDADKAEKYIKKNRAKIEAYHYDYFGGLDSIDIVTVGFKRETSS